MTSHSAALTCFAALAVWLGGAVWLDVRERRIPNLWVAAGIVFAVALQALATPGYGLFDRDWGALGLSRSLLGLATGLALFFPLYLLRFMGAGDVKLLAMVGAWFGSQLMMGAALLTLLAGGVLALLAMLFTRSSRAVFTNMRALLMNGLSGAVLQGLPTTRVRLPYSLAIAVGALGQAGWQIWGAGH